MRAMIVVVVLAISEGSASGTRTLRTMVQVLPPIACTASTSPWSTSRTAVSTSRAKKGMPPMASGTIAASLPMVVPVTQRVKFIRATMRMMNGSERPIVHDLPDDLVHDGVLQQCRPGR
ncbi:hypothetical protein STENM223S_03390 [Streptomyces tendae]